jgi:outer membrane protein TolC
VLTAHDERIVALVAASNRTRQLVMEGKAARVEQLRVDAATKSAEADRIASASQLALAEQELAQLTQVPVATIQRARFSALKPTDAAFAADTTAAMRAGLIARAFKSSSELAELNNRSRAASAGSDAARTLRYPEIRANGAFVDRGRWAGDFSGEWQFGLGVSYPLYTGGTREHNIERAAADEHAVAAHIRVAQLNIESGIDRTLASLREAHARSVALQSAVDQSAEVARIEQLSLDVGSGTQTEFLNAQANLLRVRASLVEAQHAELSARVELARVIGELSREWLARTLESAQ